MSHCKQHFSRSQLRVHFSVAMLYFDLHLSGKYKTSKIQIIKKKKKKEIKEFNLYIPEMTGLRNLSDHIIYFK